MTQGDETMDILEILQGWLGAAVDTYGDLPDGAFFQAMEDAVREFNAWENTNFDLGRWSEYL